MKTFFKKLSLVLAAAMIITLVPAKAASAEDLKALAIAKQNENTAASYAEIKVGQTADFKFFGASDWKELGWTWSIADTKIATVDKAGLVTAKAEGFTTLSIAIPSYKTATLPIYVTGDASNALALGESKATVDVAFALEVGKSIDLNFYGATGYKSNDVVTWTTSDATVAKVDNKGVVTAIAAGTAFVTCGVSVAATGKSYVGKAVITVGKSAVADFSIAQKDANTVDITFATADQATKDVKVERVVNLGNGATSNILWAVSDESSIKNNVLTLKTYVPFSNGTYRFTVGNVSKLYEAGIGDPVAVSLTYKNPLIDEDFDDEGADRRGNEPTLVVKDSKGIELKVPEEDVTYSAVAENEASVNESTGEVSLWNKNASITVKVTVEYGEADDEGNRKHIEGYATVKPGRLVKYGFESAITASGIITGDALTSKSQVDAGLGKYEIVINSEKHYHVAALIKDTLDRTWALSDYAYDADKYPRIGTNPKVEDRTFTFKYSVTNVNKAFVDPTTGEIIGVTATEASQPVYVLISLEKVVDDKVVNLGIVGAVPVTVKAESAPKTITLDRTSATVATDGAFSTAEFTTTVKDQYGKKVVDNVKEVTAKIGSGTKAKVYSSDAAKSEGGVPFVNLNANKFEIDGADFLAALFDGTNSTSKTLDFTVTTVSGLTSKVSVKFTKVNISNPGSVGYRIDTQNGEAKFKGEKSLNAILKNGAVEVVKTSYGADIANVPFKVGVPALAADYTTGDFYLEITRPDGTKVAHATGSTYDYPVEITTTDANDQIKFNKLGTYSFKLYEVVEQNSKKSLKSRATASLKLINTLSLTPTVVVKSDKTTSVVDPIILTGDDQNVQITINGKDVSANVTVEYVEDSLINLGDDVFVKKVTLLVPYLDEDGVDQLTKFPVEVEINKHFLKENHN